MPNRFMNANIHIVASFILIFAAILSNFYSSDFLASIEAAYPETHEVTEELTMVVAIISIGVAILLITGAALYGGWAYRIAIFLTALPLVILQALYLDTGHSGFTFIMGCILVIPSFFSLTFQEAKDRRHAHAGDVMG